MTCIVGITDGKKVIIGGDSQATGSDIKTTMKGKKIFQKNDIIFGVTGSPRYNQILEYIWSFDPINKEEDEFEYLVKTVVPTAMRTLEENKCSDLNNGRLTSDSAMLIGIRNRLFCMYSDFQISESTKNYMAIGSGVEFALGALTVLENMDITNKQKLEQALEAASFHSSTCSGPYHFMETNLRIGN